MRQDPIYQHLNGTIYFLSAPFSQIWLRGGCVPVAKQKACKIAMRCWCACVCVTPDDRFSRNLVRALCYLGQPHLWFWTPSQNCENRLLASSCLSAWNNSAPIGRIFKKFDILSIFGKYIEKNFF